MADRLVIGIDNGTQGTKCVVFSLSRGRVVAEAHAAHALIEGPGGRREQDPADWIAAAETTLRACLSVSGVRPADVVAMGVSGQQHGFVPLDRAGAVIRPAKLWCDTETAPECEAITRAAGGRARVIRATGNAVAVGFTASKVRWLKEHEPRRYARLATILLPHDYLNFWLTGERRTECGDASGTAYFDVRRRRWSEPMLRAVEPDGRLRDCVPELVAPDEPLGTLRPALARRFGLPAGVLVAAGGGDNMMAAIGTGNVAPGVVTASLGTSGTIFASSDVPVVDPRGELAAFCSSTGRWLPLVCTMNVTVATELTRRLFGLTVREFDRHAALAPPGAEGLLLLPYFNGERTPALPMAQGVLCGMRSGNTTRANVCRAAMEGATFGLRYGLDVLRRQGVAPAEIRLVGGGARSALWRQVAADLLNCPVVCPRVPEAAAMGAVLQALWCRLRQEGGSAGIAELTRRYIALDERTRASPDRARAADYAARYDRYRTLDRTLRPLWKEEGSAALSQNL